MLLILEGKFLSKNHVNILKYKLYLKFWPSHQNRKIPIPRPPPLFGTPKLQLLTEQLSIKTIYKTKTIKTKSIYKSLPKKSLSKFIYKDKD